MRSRTKVAPLPGMPLGKKLMLLRTVLNAGDQMIQAPKWAAPADIRRLDALGYIKRVEVKGAGKRAPVHIYLTRGSVAAGAAHPVSARARRLAARAIK